MLGLTRNFRRVALFPPVSFPSGLFRLMRWSRTTWRHKAHTSLEFSWRPDTVVLWVDVGKNNLPTSQLTGVLRCQKHPWTSPCLIVFRWWLLACLGAWQWCLTLQPSCWVDLLGASWWTRPSMFTWLCKPCDWVVLCVMICRVKLLLDFLAAHQAGHSESKILNQREPQTRVPWPEVLVSLLLKAQRPKELL